MFTSFLNIILQFDGSLRRLSEIDKSIQIPPSLLKSTQPISTCSASITTDEGNIIALGVKRIRRSVSSADIEYEGLIIGLEWLLSKGILDKYRYQNINVRGDCKTVVDQMNLKSFPRKQYQYYQCAKNLEKQICSKGIKISFEHVSRELNSLCDASCEVLLHITQIEDILSFKKYLKKLELEYEVQKLPSSKKKRMNMRSMMMEGALNKLRDVPVSTHPFFLCELCILAWKKQDYVGTRMVGERLLENLKNWSACGVKIEDDTMRRMKSLGVISVYSSLIRLDLKRESEKYFSDIPLESTINREALCDHDFMNEILTLQNLVPSTHFYEKEPEFSSDALGILYRTLLKHIHLGESLDDAWWKEFHHENESSV